MTEMIAKYGTSAGVGAVVLGKMLPNGRIITPFGNYNGMLVGAALGVGTRLTADLVSQFVIPEISEDKRLQSVAGAGVELGAGAAGLYVMGRALNPELVEALGDGSLAYAAGLGAASVAASDYLWQNWVRPMVGKPPVEQSLADF